MVAAAPRQHPGEAAGDVVQRPADDDVVVEGDVKCDEDCAVADTCDGGCCDISFIIGSS